MKYLGLEKKFEKTNEIKVLERQIRDSLGSNKIKIKKMPFVEACIFAEEKKLTILNNSSIDKILFLFNLEERSRFFENSLIWTGTIISYAEKYKSFRESKMYSKEDSALVFESDKISGLKYILPISEELAELNRCALVLEHPNYKLDWYGDEIVFLPKKPTSIKVLNNFPSYSGWFNLDKEFGLPINFNNDYRSGSHYFIRNFDFYLGPIARSPKNNKIFATSLLDGEFYTIFKKPETLLFRIINSIKEKFYFFCWLVDQNLKKIS